MCHSIESGSYIKRKSKWKTRKYVARLCISWKTASSSFSVEPSRYDPRGLDWRYHSTQVGLLTVEDKSELPKAKFLNLNNTRKAQWLMLSVGDTLILAAAGSIPGLSTLESQSMASTVTEKASRLVKCLQVAKSLSGENFRFQVWIWITDCPNLMMVPLNDFWLYYGAGQGSLACCSQWGHKK